MGKGFGASCLIYESCTTKAICHYRFWPKLLRWSHTTAVENKELAVTLYYFVYVSHTESQWQNHSLQVQTLGRRGGVSHDNLMLHVCRQSESSVLLPTNYSISLQTLVICCQASLVLQILFALNLWLKTLVLNCICPHADDMFSAVCAITPVITLQRKAVLQAGHRYSS